MNWFSNIFSKGKATKKLDITDSKYEMEKKKENDKNNSDGIILLSIITVILNEVLKTNKSLSDVSIDYVEKVIVLQDYGFFSNKAKSHLYSDFNPWIEIAYKTLLLCIEISTGVEKVYEIIDEDLKSSMTFDEAKETISTALYVCKLASLMSLESVGLKDNDKYRSILIKGWSDL